jgi:hypothetical protein
LYHFAVILHFRCVPSNVVVFPILGIIGFDAFPILLAVAATDISAFFSHCGADVKGGVLNCLFVTSELHRWHHAADVPQGYGYSCNYGVEFSFWDSLFGTYYLPSRTASSSRWSESGSRRGCPTNATTPRSCPSAFIGRCHGSAAPALAPNRPSEVIASNGKKSRRICLAPPAIPGAGLMGAKRW